MYDNHKMIMWIFILLSIYLINLSPISGEKKLNKHVSTLINAKWKETPLLLEVAEYLNDENPSYFWNFIDEVIKRKSEFEKRDTPKDHYNLIISIAENFLSSSEISVMKLGLSLRIYSAKIEMFCQMAENNNISHVNCDNFIDIGGKLACSVEELKKFIQQDYSCQVDVYSVDHIYQEKTENNKTLILYGNVGSDGFSVLHNELKELANANKFNYILRHYIKNRPKEQVRLSGYGVELQMKSTEYKSTDDSDIRDKEEKSVEDVHEGSDEVDGIDFSILKKLYPNDQKKLSDLHHYFLENNHEIGALKVWQFQELSFQAAERIMNSSPKESIDILTNIAQNFPTQAKTLIKLKVNNDMKKEMKLNQELFSVSLNIHPSETALFINGIFLDFETIDMLTLLESLRTELRVMESIHKIDKK